MQELSSHQLRIFCAVARLGSFTRAAQDLYISQPAVSVQVRSLERALGVHLVDRLAREVVLTEAGRIVYDYATRIFNLTEEMGRAVDDLRGLRAGVLLLGASGTPGAYLLPQALGAFRQRYPEIRAELLIANSAEIARRVLSHELDLGVVGEAVSDASISSIPYTSDELVVFTSPRHRFAKMSAIALAEVGSEPFVMREVGSATRKWAEQSLREAGLQIQVVMELGNNEAVKRAVAAELGIGMLSRYALDLELQAGALAIADVAGLECRRMLYVIHHREKRLTYAQRAFLELLPVEVPGAATTAAAPASGDIGREKRHTE